MIKMPLFGLGTAQIGQIYGLSSSNNLLNNQEEVNKIISTIKNNMKKIDVIDTARSYGQSENDLGKSSLNDLKIISKIPKINNEKIFDNLLNIINTSLTNLNIDNFYALLLHDDFDLLRDNGDKIYKFLVNLKNQGIVKKIGISIYSPSNLNNILQNYDIDIVQAPYNIIDRRLKISGYLDKLKKLSIEVHARSVFLQGLLLMNRINRPKKFQKFNDVWEVWDNWLQEMNITAYDACLNFICNENKIDKRIIGISGIKQLEELLQFKKINSSLQYPNFEQKEKLINPYLWNQI